MGGDTKHDEDTQCNDNTTYDDDTRYNGDTQFDGDTRDDDDIQHDYNEKYLQLQETNFCLRRAFIIDELSTIS